MLPDRLQRIAIRGDFSALELRSYAEMRFLKYVETTHSAGLMDEDKSSRIEQLQQAYRKVWKPGNLQIFRDFVEAIDENRRFDLLPEVIKLDMELRANDGFEAHDPTIVEDYLTNYPTLVQTPHLVPIIVHEYRCRQIWGPAPSIYEYLRRFRLIMEQLEMPLRECIGELFQVELQIRNENNLIHSRRVTKPLTLGRQQLSEPPPFTLISGWKADRLIFATPKERQISRRQLHIELVAKNRVMLHNMSHQVQLEVTQGHKNEIFPEETLEFEMPVGVKVLHYQIGLEMKDCDGTVTSPDAPS